MKLLFLFTLFIFSCHLSLAELIPLVSEDLLKVLNELKVGQCIDNNDRLADIDVTPNSDLHPHPDYSGCYPRVLINGIAYGLDTKVTVEAPPFRELCRYFELEDLVEQKSNHFDCSMWPTE